MLPGGRGGAALDRRVRRPRRRRIRRVPDALAAGAAQPGMEGLVRLGRPRRRAAGGAPDRAGRGAGLRLPGQGADGRRVRGARASESRADQLRGEADDAPRPVQRGVLDGGRAVLRRGPRRRQAARSAPSPRTPGTRLYCDIIDQDKAEHVARRLLAARHVLGLGDPDHEQVGRRVQPDELSQRLGVAARQRVDRGGAEAVRVPRKPRPRLATAIFDAAIHTDYMRLPELFCGFTRRTPNRPVGYPVACSPAGLGRGIAVPAPAGDARRLGPRRTRTCSR